MKNYFFSSFEKSINKLRQQKYLESMMLADEEYNAYEKQIEVGSSLETKLLYFHKLGFSEGYRMGKLLGILKGRISILEELRNDGILSEEQFQPRIKPLRKKLDQLQSDL